jgi:chloramphenicol O-acetyltransferase
MDKKGINPKALTDGDTNYSTVIFSNLGSIKSNSCYHHLSEYGTNSIIITIGTIREEKGRRVVDMTFTLDERIADGFYFAKSVNMAQEVMLNPELLTKELGQKINFED